MAEYVGRLGRLARQAFRSGGRASWRAQLRSATLLDQIRHPDEQLPDFTFDAVELARANDLVRLAELERTPRERRADPGDLREVAQTYSDLALRIPRRDPSRMEQLALAASTWSLAGYQANAAAIARGYMAEIDLQTGSAPLTARLTSQAAPAGIAAVVAAVLRRDVREVGRLGAVAANATPGLGRRLVAEAGEEPLDMADTAVLAAYGLAGRAARALARFWRMGDRPAGQRAVDDLRRAAKLMLDAAVVDTWALLDNLAHVVEDLVATSPWRLLRPITMPTSAGKTNIAEWAILDALAAPASPGSPRKLVVYIVPSRALAGEVERHLTRTLGRVGLRVSGLFGGAEHVQYELRLIATTDVLVVTSEKFDLLLRNDDSIVERIALIVADEGHLLGERTRGLRLELVLARARRHAPRARLLVLSAVLPNGEDVAAWIEPNAAGRNLVNVRWSPSTLRAGVFSWQGRAVDGQHGVVTYRASDVDHGFFLPYVITRHKKSTRLFPTEKKDIAAELAVHYERLGPVLIAAPKKASARAVAAAVMKACKTHDVTFGADGSGTIPVEVLTQRERVTAAVAEFAGEDHELSTMARAGVAYHHADIPEPVRREIEQAYRSGAIRVLCATSTLGQGVNLPAKTVIVSGTLRNRDDELPVRDFQNVAGRAGRPFRETEGHVILVADSTAEANRLRARYITDPQLEPVYSTLLRLYAALLTRRMGGRAELDELPDDLEFGDDVEGDLAEWAETLDLQLLSLLAEEVVETADEAVLVAAVDTALRATLGAVQIERAGAPLHPLSRFAARRIKAVAARVPDADLRHAFVRTGLSLAGCESALTAAEAVVGALEDNPELLLEERWADLRSLLLAQAIDVAEVRRTCAQEKINPAAVPALAADWMDGLGVDELRQRHGDTLGATDPMKFAKVLDRIVVQNLAWVLSAVVQAFEGPITAVAAMAKYGVNTVAACYAASVGIRHRPDAMTIGSLFPTDFGSSFARFLDWVNTLRPADITGVVAPDTARLLFDRVAALGTPEDALELMVTETGTVMVPIRGIRHAGAAEAARELPTGVPLSLVREYDNPADPNAIVVTTQDGTRLGYAAREAARILAPLIDLEDGPSVIATLGVRPTVEDEATGGEVRAMMQGWDVVRMKVTVAPR